MKKRKARSAPPANAKGGPHKGDWHVSHSSMGMGDYYGTGVKQNLGIMRDSYTPPVNTTNKKSLKKAPRSLA